MAINYMPTFRAATDYERQQAEARRREALAQALESQAYQPLSGSDAPTPAAAPLVMALQSFITARQRRKGQEAEEKARQADIEGVERLRQELKPEQRIMAPANEQIAASVGMPQVSETGEVTYGPAQQTPLRTDMVGPTAAERRSLFAQYGELGTPSAQRLAKVLASMEPEDRQEKFGTTPVLSESGEYVLFGEGGTARPTGVRAAPKTADMPNAVREYEYAKSQGYTGSFADWELRNRQAGAAKFVMPTEGERKDSYNLGRIVNASETIKNAIAADPTAATPGIKETVISALPFIDEAAYLAQSPSRQVIAAAQADLIDASLTLATGAAYTKEQLRGQYESLVPRLGESKESIAAKAKRVETIIEAAKIRAGRAWTPQLETAMRSAFTMPISKAKVDNSAPPAGVAPEEWAVMTPEERQLWQK
jgi:hypothetical protein